MRVISNPDVMAPQLVRTYQRERNHLEERLLDQAQAPFLGVVRIAYPKA